MVVTGTDPEYSVSNFLNAVRANLILNIGTEPKKTHFIKTGYIDVHLYSKSHLMAQPEIGFRFYQQALNQTGND